MKLSSLRWLAIAPLIPAVPLLFFGLLWLGVVQLLVGALLVGAAATTWRLSAGQWAAWPFESFA
jgi:hypothetical protein